MSQGQSETMGLRGALLSRENLNNTPITCPHCGRHSVLVNESWTQIVSAASGFAGVMKISMVGGAKCTGCDGLIAACRTVMPTGPQKIQLIWPLDVRPDRAPPGLDAGTKSAYDEARQILSLSPQAAAVLARRCLQHVLRQKLQVNPGTLFKEIQAAIELDVLSRNTKEALDHVRTIGNWGAHPAIDEADALIEVSFDDAVYTLEVLELLFNDLYVQPAKSASMKAALDARRK